MRAIARDRDEIADRSAKARADVEQRSEKNSFVGESRSRSLIRDFPSDSSDDRRCGSRRTRDPAE